jgi:hypothetical protein
VRRLSLLGSLVRVRISRLVLWLNCVLQLIKLRLPFRLASFPLLPFLRWKLDTEVPKRDQCESSLTKSVDVIVSLYNFQKHTEVLAKSLESCMTNSKVTFHFVLVSATPGERSWLENLVGKSHHRIHVSDERIGIYAAWNMAISECTGDFITNLNADDIRLPHSICHQANNLQNTSADGSYGNFVLSLNIADSLHNKDKKHLVSELPSFGLETLVDYSQNFMHCAPMWRRDLHDRFGFFDESLKSSGDTEFWLRAMESGAQFSPYKPTTVVYFHNPEGLSTSLASIGREEWSRIRDNHLKKRQLQRL